MHSSRMRSARVNGRLLVGCLLRGGVCPRADVSVRGVVSATHPRPRGQTDACENITLAQTSFVGVKFWSVI